MNKILEAMAAAGKDIVLTDSRSLREPQRSVFFALHTANNDGHKYIPELAVAGVSLFVVEKRPEGIAGDFIVVENTLDALQSAAEDYRNLFHGHMVAVIGSKGKTIVKEWLAEGFAFKALTSRSPRSWNSQIGVPRAVLGLNPSAEYAVVEAGATAPGEMARLAAVVQPETVVVTGIEPLGENDTFSDFYQKAGELLKMAYNASRVIFPAELLEAVERNVPAAVMKIAVELPPSADWIERDRLLTTETLRFYGVQLPEDTVRPLYTRLNASDGVNNCTIITDRFTCDTFSLDSALDFTLRRKTAHKKVTVILDTLRDCDQKPQIAEVDRIIYVGKGGMTKEEFCQTISVSDFNNELILVKGEEGGVVATFGEQLQARHHETVLEVNLDAIVHNFNHFRALLKPTTGIVCMVKASGYGAGAYELAKTLQSQGAAYLAVAVVDEGEELRRAGITMPIMALNPKVTNYDSLFSNHLEPEIFSFDMLDEFIREGRKRNIRHYPIHVKFDTGMHRLGFLEEDIPALCSRLGNTDVVIVESVFSHLATADCLDMDDYTNRQLALFVEICEKMKSALGYAFKRHILNSAGIARFPQYQFEMVRLGISLYGVDTIGVPQTRGLRTVSTLRSIIISIKEWPEGTSIGYGRRTILDRKSRVATVPVGYADGLDRHLGNRLGKVWVNGTLCPILGNVCMDACMVDITDVPKVEVGTSVEFFGENLPVCDVSDALQTIPYEILTSVSPRVKRIYYRE
ncbi:MAG: alanine racemase [Bacteroides sp.]|nr:alanine racemase [Bacteroides sp.]MCM1379846.1 alanine racemase [Bacteroides sp.]MCM1446122.1 alanine racemase [Prevotella sp.]